jgi:hypothetical protein
LSRRFFSRSSLRSSRSKALLKSRGRITDEQGAILPGVAILVTNEATGVFREVTSSAEGTYFASQLVPGRYKIVAKLTGFRTLERSGLVLQVGNALTINLVLAVGGIEETSL